MKALVLAAGYATRLYPLTADRPKALLPLAGATILDLLIDKLEELDGLDEILIVSNARFYNAFEEWLQGRRSSKRIRILNDGTTSEANRLGAIGDIQWTLDATGLADDLFVLAGDNVCSFSLKGFVDFFGQCGRDCILVRELDDPEELHRVGVVELDEEGRVLSFEEKPAQPRSKLGVFAMYLYRKDTLPLFRQYLEEGNRPDAPSHFPEWLYKRKEIRAYPAEGDIEDIGTPGAYREARLKLGL
ncbi:nucleotidyltransferase family protein [Gorillibacterium sp. sgz5001074]|uniref:nucleotidyltransferase family protein n=1 Tax=Gorillibacterium sp. sgz5001074 TaxID=3446695 RepID=UPI003F660DF0